MTSSDPSCSSRWKFPQASSTPISSGFYTFAYDSTHALCQPLIAVGVADTSLPLAQEGGSLLFYYDNGVLYNWGWKASLKLTGCPEPAGLSYAGWSGSQ